MGCRGAGRSHISAMQGVVGCSTALSCPARQHELPFPGQRHPKDQLQGAVCFILVHGKQKEIKDIYNRPWKGKIQANGRLQGL